MHKIENLLMDEISQANTHTWSKIDSCINAFDSTALQIASARTVSGYEHGVGAEKRAKGIAQVEQVGLATGEETAILVLQLKDEKKKTFMVLRFFSMN